MKTNLLFVCLGNICRSPSAEGVMKALVEQRNVAEQYYIDSAGTAAYHQGEPADARMRQHASRRGYDLTSVARKVKIEDFNDFDYIVAMDNDNYRNLMQMTTDKEQQSRVVKMVDFATEHQVDVVPDPYYGGEEGFEKVLDILEDATKGFLAHLQGR